MMFAQLTRCSRLSIIHRVTTEAEGKEMSSVCATVIPVELNSYRISHSAGTRISFEEIEAR